MGDDQDILLDRELSKLLSNNHSNIPPRKPAGVGEELPDAFIVYGRADSHDFALKLTTWLEEADWRVWTASSNLPPGADVQTQINQVIEMSHNVVFVISPDSTHSKDCRHQLKLALKLNKRIIPVMYLETLSRDLWQQQNPQGTDEDWDQVQARGLHISDGASLLAIGKMHWIMCREGLDDVTASLTTLLDVFERHREYVEQHTDLLVKALHWHRNQRRSPLLLPPDVCPQAADWLSTRFYDEQPPCLPTDYHSQFITESLKHARGGMTQVFLSYSEDDDIFKQELQRQLLRQGITTWTSDTDIKTGEDFQDAINRGIERADNLVFLMSRQSLSSEFCQQEIRHAQLYNKRIIPLLIEPLEDRQIPTDLRALQFVDCSNHQNPDSFQQDIARDVAALLNVLQDGEDYYEQHKRVLVKALEWDHHERRKDFLLRGNEFVDAETWLEVAKQTQRQPPPTRLHTAFIEASREMNRFFDAFISYGRADSLDFAKRLEQELAKEGFNLWFDKNDIPPGVDYQQQIDDGIGKAHNFIFILSPHAVNSPYCLKEIEFALTLNKRIIPLLHVETLDHATWQQRNPLATEADWQTFQANGLDSIYPNMHPVVSKINWIYFREGVDSFEQGRADLINLFHRHENYVRQHTVFLIQALDWQRHQRKVEYLLTGDDRAEAEQWLKAPFEDEQSPCVPTDLHCEFICESIKNANHLMTQVFISHAEVDHVAREKLRYTLMREGITIWINRTDIKTGTEFQEEINRGIEEADNLVLLMSRASLESEYCRQELEYALYLNKRVIPLLIETMDMEDIPMTLRSLQFIDFTEYANPEAYRSATNKLLNILDEDAMYHTQHKLLLVKALKWKQQKYNPSILLRGYELRHYRSWFQVAKQHPQFRATPLQEEFLAVSEQQPPDKTLNVFVSYSQADADFVRKLNNTLQIQGMTTWFDQENIEAGVDFQQEIFKGIENSENFLFIISPSSVTSPFCKDEVEYAQRLNKRIVTVLYREVSSALLHPALAPIQWIDFRRHGGDFLSNFGELLRTLASDPDHVRMHTRLLVRSREWQESDQDDSFLLRGKDLQSSVSWLKQAEHRDPKPTDLQQRYIQASQELPHRRIRPRSVVLSGLAVTVLVAIARSFGLLQPAELAAYDHLLRLRPNEPPDDRMAIVVFDEESSRDLREQMIDGEYEPGLGTIPDGALADALTQLQVHQPRLIGIDFYRDFPTEPVLAERLETMPNVVGVCKAAALDEDSIPVEGNIPLPELSIDQGQVGFSDFADDGGKYLRRNYLMQAPDPEYCNTREALNLVLARRYLEAEGYSYRSPLNERGNYEANGMRFGETSVPVLWGNGSGYRDRGRQLEGYQTLLNFRKHQGRAEQFAQVIPFKDLLSGQISEDEVGDRIVLIGYSDRADRNADYWNTPYGAMPGVFLQGQMTSQLISAVLDDRPLIWWWPIALETLWVLGWATAAGFIVWWYRHPRSLLLAGGGALIVLYGTCYVVLASQAGWLALVPAAIAMIGTGGVVAYLNHRVRVPH